jgi:dTDP-4-amino-4,6-dideoxygalactose transaminase
LLKPGKLKRIVYIPFLHIHPSIKKEILMEFERFYDEQEYILGSGVEKFEQEFAAFNGVRFSIGVGNGHDALLIILKSLGIGPGDEVILPAHTFIATALSVVNSGATPVLVDIDPHTFNISPNEVKRKITPKTKAIVAVHIYGNPADVPSLLQIARDHNIDLIEDFAQSHGAGIDGQKTGSFGVMNFTSFYPTKNIGSLGDAGMITTNSSVLAEKARALRNYGKTEDGKYSEIGINSRLDELHARLLSVKLNHLSDWNEERIEIAKWYEGNLLGLPEIELQRSYTKSINVRHIFPILTEERDSLMMYLKQQGVETLIHYSEPINLHSAFAFLGYKTGDYPVAEKICKQELSLPIYPGLTKNEVEYICAKVIDFLGTL